MKSRRIIAAVMSAVMCSVCALPCIQGDAPSFGIAAEAAESVVKGFGTEYDPAEEVLVLKWSKVKNADAYRISVKRDGETKYRSYKVVSGASCSVDDVMEGEKLAIKISALKKDGKNYRSLGSSAFNVTAKAKDESTPMGVITALNVVKCDRKSATLQWNTVKGADSYAVYYRTVDAKKFKKADGKVSIMGKKARIIIKGLAKGTEYVFRVAPVNKSGTEGSYVETTYTLKAGSSTADSASGAEIMERKGMPSKAGYDDYKDYVKMLEEKGFELKKTPDGYDVYYAGVYTGKITIGAFDSWYIK